MAVLDEAEVPYLVGGAFALRQYADIDRFTRDLDLFIRPFDLERALDAYERAGFRTEVTAPHWLAKVVHEDLYVDLIFSSGNGVATVDDTWFDRAVQSRCLDVPAWLIPAEEMIWSKGFVMERERFDGADVLHIILRMAERLDWDRILDRFGEHWRVLFAHLVLFGFAYPTERWRIPGRVLRELIRRLEAEVDTRPDGDAIVAGTLLSRTQYLPGVRRWGFGDARLLPPAEIPADELEVWDDAGVRENGGEVPG
jgi:hypothetical protein